ncbi:MAG: DNA-processing protein DprA [Defluviitaleaceae bacterium]|nr:DNA-processing protein DprA [Defluviitaleaceae bacterium]
MKDDIYMIWLSSLVHHIGSRKLNFLLEIFGDARAIFNASHEELHEHLPNAKHAFDHITRDRNLDTIETLLRKMEKQKIAYISRDNPRFPTLLREIPDSPLGLFFIGNLPPDSTDKVAIIGSRKCSEYGLLTARLLARPLAAAGVVIVSGMARGVDSMAHRGALQGGGITVAVLGCGVDICYPAENKQLKEDILKKGCIISEYAPGVRPAPAFFPARNRIISGLCRGVIVTEAGLKSGTLITVDQAQEQGREVLAVPGNISSKLSQGTNQLIRDGAFPVSCHEDILSVLGIIPTPQPEEEKKIQQNVKISLATDEKRVYDNLSLEPISFDMLADVSSVEIGKLHLICTGLELKGLAKKLPGSRYIRNI